MSVPTLAPAPESSSAVSSEHLVRSDRAPRCGIVAALWIPTDEDGGLRCDLLKRHLEWLKACGSHGVMALGSTGEFARMGLSERKAVIEAVAELASPLPVLANISSIRLDEAIDLGRTAVGCGVDGVAIMPPSFFPVSQADMLEFFLRVADAVDLPIYLYNYPEVTGNRIGPEVIEAFAQRAPMVGIKQSGGELAYHDTLIALGRKHGFSVFTAADPSLEMFLMKGADGCLGGLGNFVPELMREVYEACAAGAPGNARIASERLGRIGQAIAPLNLPYNVRAGMEARGFDPGAFKTIVAEETLTTYALVREELRGLFGEWELPPAP